MKAHLSILACLLALAAVAKPSAVRHLATPENYAILVSTNKSDAAKKLALQKQIAEAVIADEQQTEEGRLRWHGRYVGQRVDLDKATATYIHEDGTEHTVKFAKPDLKGEIERANARLPMPPMTNGVPVALASARMKRYGEKTGKPKTVTMHIRASRGKPPKKGADK